MRDTCFVVAGQELQRRLEKPGDEVPDPRDDVVDGVPVIVTLFPEVVKFTPVGKPVTVTPVAPFPRV